ncbi:MAG: VOC family protein [Acidiferrobacterales bacterium]|nr:VOC family protein [Acidiferrobacterales bacterium]
MIDHFEIKVVAFSDCVSFYNKVLEPLGIELKWSDKTAAGFGKLSDQKVIFLFEKSIETANVHIAFSAANKSEVKAFHQHGIELGYRCNGKPGLRENYAANYYAAFLLDPDGNNIEAVTYI